MWKISPEVPADTPTDASQPLAPAGGGAAWAVRLGLLMSAAREACRRVIHVKTHSHAERTVHSPADYVYDAAPRTCIEIMDIKLDRIVTLL